MKLSTRGALCGALALLSTATLAAQDARAGTYTVFSCRGPISGPAPVSDGAGGWRHESGPRAEGGLSFDNGCDDGDHLVVGVGGPDRFGDSYVYSQATFRPPADTRISAFSIEWQGYAIHRDSGKAGFVVLDTDQQRFAEHVGTGGIARRTTRASGLDASYVTLHAGCQRGSTVCGGYTDGGKDAHAALLSSEVVLADASTPTGTVFGPAVQQRTWTGPQELVVDAEDRGAGVSTVALVVDGQEGAARLVDDNGGRCVEREEGRRYVHPQPCKLDPAAITLAVDPTTLPEGTHDVRVVLRDAAANARQLPVGEKVVDVRPPVLDGEITVSGSGREGEPLTCVAPVVDGQEPSVAYAWFRMLADGSGRAEVAGASASTYVPGATDVGRKLVCRVTATDGGGAASSESALTSGPFSNGRTVREVCDGMPAGPRDACGDLDRDGKRNRDDDDADGDGVPRASDPDDLDAGVTGRTTNATPSSVHTTTHSSTETVRVSSSSIPDGPLGAVNGKLGGPGALLTVHHEGSTSRTVRVPHGRRVVLEGRLRAPDGQGVGGAKLEVSTQDRTPGSAFEPFGTLLTAADGSYRLIVPAGPSRTVRVGYRARFGDATFAQTSDVLVLVRAGMRFRLSHTRMRNGQTVRYVGRVLGPRTGHRFVEVQVRVGRRWIVVCSVRTDAKGGFGCAHRFTKTFQRTRYVFRARIRRQSTLPYEPAVSGRRSLVVRP